MTVTQEAELAAIAAEPVLRRSYAAARRLNAEHGRTYYLATLMLPAWKRPYVHALYGFARYADDIVDSLDSQLPAADRAAWLADWGGRLVDTLHRGADATDDSVLPAVIHTIRRWDLPVGYFESFLTSMAMDLTVTGYDTFDDLMTYVYGSGTVIGLQMLPVLGPSSPAAAPYAGDLGTAFQLINFLRDVGEDLRRGRVYLPRESMELFGVTREKLATGVVDGAVRRLLRHEIGRARELLRAATPGIRLLHPTSRDCMWTAARLYGGILDEIEKADYQVLSRRVAVGTPRRLAVAGGVLVRSRARRLVPRQR
ncbi:MULTISPECIES: phytoene/squalene synthase family protein [Pseudofrankia]|uniref:phytoene/squalene synthase family protein n=1 Tax=Pseudofrankia TaxID=2994363 RepID=UPI000234D1B2|nr:MULTISPECIES: phytoene/squalene synthase family protein [Pseudofrankia]OHV40633.1 phytoene synthase [Pseudofrankia sp. EUN1h]